MKPVDFLKQVADDAQAKHRRANSDGINFFQFHADENGMPAGINFIRIDGSVDIPTPEVTAELGQRARAIVAAAFEKQRETGSDFLFFQGPPFALAVQILFGEIAQLRMDAAKDKGGRNSTD